LIPWPFFGGGVSGSSGNGGSVGTVVLHNAHINKSDEDFRHFLPLFRFLSRLKNLRTNLADNSTAN